MTTEDAENATALPSTTNPLKTQLISQLLEERREAKEGGDLRNRNPLDESEPFQQLCMACRRGDIKTVQSLISFEKVNINAVDRFDYPPLTLASLCGHYDVVKLLLENGAVCERDTFQGERCLYNALNNRIRNLLLQYDYSKSSDPLQPWAAGVSSLLARAPLDSTDITVHAFDAGSAVMTEFRLHKFLLAARSPYLRRKFHDALATHARSGTSVHERHKAVRSLQMASSIDARAFETAIQFMYLGEIADTESQDVVRGIERLSRHLEMPGLWEMVMVVGDRKKRRQVRTEAVERAQGELDAYFREFVLGKKIVVSSAEEAKNVWVEQNNESFADVLLQAEEEPYENGGETEDCSSSKSPKVVLYPVHKGILRSEFFATMFTSNFIEGRKPLESEGLQIIPIETTPAVLELALSFLYSEKTEIPLEYALDLLFVAEQLMLDRLKLKCSHVICSATNNDDLPYSIYDVIRAGWLCRVRRLEEFGAKYIADRLEHYILDPDFAELVAESAAMIEERQLTDTIEVLDEVRYYLGMRFRQRLGEADAFLEGEELDEEEEEERDALFERRERLQNQLLEGIDALLENLKLDA